MRWLALAVLAVLVAGSGCTASPRTDPPPTPAARVQDPWSNTTAHLTYTAFAMGDLGAAAGTDPYTFQVAHAASRLVVVVHLHGEVGSEAVVHVYPQTCGRDDACDFSAQTKGGQATLRVANATAGAWSLTVFPDPADRGTMDLDIDLLA